MAPRRPARPLKRPLMIDAVDFARIVEHVKTNRVARRMALIRRWQDQRRQLGLEPEPDKRELRHFCQMVESDPHSLQLLERDVIEAMNFFLARFCLKQMPSRPLSTAEVGRWVERLIDGGRPLGDARRWVAEQTGKTEEAVIIAHRRSRKRQTK
jgi:hypothetical protein